MEGESTVQSGARPGPNLAAAGPAGVWFVIPAFNEGEKVGEVISHVRTRFPNVVVVDDGSSDDTLDVSKAAGACVLRHLINRGQGAALKTGIDYALRQQAKVIVTFDSDGQHQLDDVNALILPILEDRCDMVLGSRFLDSNTSVPRTRWVTLKLGIIFTRLVSNLRVTDTHNGLRAFSRLAAQKIRIKQDRMAHASEILDEIGRLKLRYVEVPTHILYTDYSRRKGQKSSAAFRIVWDFLIGKTER